MTLVDHPAHWHVVGYGLSELDAKESNDAAVSGLGFELVVRLEPEGEGPPMWAVDLLANLAAYVWSSGHGFESGHTVDLRGPIRLDERTPITAAALVTDPQLGVMEDGPFGRVEFLQLVGIHADELEQCRIWGTERVVGLLALVDPLLVTRLHRPSLLEDPVLRLELEESGPPERLSELRVGSLDVVRRGRHARRVLVRMGAGAAQALGPALARCLERQGSEFRLVGDDCELRFVITGALPSWSDDGRVVTVVVAPDAVADLAAVFNGSAGSIKLPDHTSLSVVVLP
jgi:hypothetical protein